MATSRITVRVPQPVLEELKLAASLEGCEVAQFAISAAVEKAKVILQAEEQALRNKELLSKIT